MLGVQRQLSFVTARHRGCSSATLARTAQLGLDGVGGRRCGRLEVIERLRVAPRQEQRVPKANESQGAFGLIVRASVKDFSAWVIRERAR